MRRMPASGRAVGARLVGNSRERADPLLYQHIFWFALALWSLDIHRHVDVYRHVEPFTSESH
jgi:hypothetical protein